MNSVELNNMAVWQNMATIDLEQMGKVKLMNRVDTKFIANDTLLEQLLLRASNDYAVQQINHLRVARYDTLYFDTADEALFLLHHNRHLSRQKVRTRTYLDSDNLSFLEIKNKNNKGRTKKKRIQIDRADFMDFSHNAHAVEFENQRGYYTTETLVAQVRTLFDRITLVNSNHTERLTIDLNLRFENLTTGLKANLPNIMVIELKQDGLMLSRIREIMLDMRIMPSSMSKYCIGTTLTNPTVKSNRFKQKIRKIDKVGGCNTASTTTHFSPITNK